MRTSSFSSLSLVRVSSSVFSPRIARVTIPRRFLNLHEYQSKEILARFGVSIQRGKAVSNAMDARPAALQLSSETGKNEYVVKAQILAGGRGKGTFLDTGFKGGVHLVKTPEEVEHVSEKMLGHYLKTHQTGPHGVQVNKVLVAELVDIASEKYFAVVLDRSAQGPVLVASPRGGMDIEEVARSSPQDIYTVPVDIHQGPDRAKLVSLAQKLGFSGSNAEQAADEMSKIYRLFVELDCTQVEINPFAQTPEGRAVICDAKLNFDDNARFRQSEIFSMEDSSESDPRELEASKWELNYVGLDGNIGCLVNGAGLAMATMDIIQLYGGKPANFLDVGGSATTKQVTQAFKILTSDSSVKAILVNIFGGIMRCDVIAEGIVTAAREVGLNVPLIVRLEGTNVERGREILSASGLNIVSASNLDDAAVKAVATLKNV